MKKALIAIALVMISLITACTGSSTNTNNGLNEAEKFVHDSLMRVLQQCGEDYFFSYTRPGAFYGGQLYIDQLKNIRFSSTSEHLSEADRLNGISWKGTVVFHVGASRTFPDYRPNDANLIKKWSRWESHSSKTHTAPLEVSDGLVFLEKTASRWETRRGSNLEWSDRILKHMSCEELQSFNGSSPRIAEK